MRICLFTPSFLPRIGGMEVVVDRLARLFLAAGHEVTVLAKTQRVAERAAAAMPNDLPYRLVRYPRTRSQVWLLGSTRQTLLSEHAAQSFDVIHAHQAYPTGHVAVAARSALGVPVVITSHRGDIGEASRYRRRWITRRRMVRAMRHADAVTGVSPELKDIIDGLTGGRANSLIIPNGVDVDAVAPANAPPALAGLAGLAAQPFLLTLGRLHPYKGLDLLLNALAAVRSRGASAPRLVIAGDGRIRADLERQAAELGIADSITFAGAAFGDAKNWLLANCTVFVQPSREEGMPLTVLEAMAAGKPILGSDLPGIRQLVRPGKSGALFAVASAGCMADAITHLLADPAALQRMGAAARRTAAEHAWPRIAARYLDLFASLSARRSS